MVSQGNTYDRVWIDPLKTPWYDRFFEAWAFDSPQELFRALSGFTLKLRPWSRSQDLRRSGLSGWVYWVLYLRGYLQYLDEYDVTLHNLYLQYLVEYFGPQGHDPGLKSLLADRTRARARVILRYEEIGRFERFDVGRDTTLEVDPITLVVGGDGSSRDKVLHLSKSGVALLPGCVDGYHRLFLGRLFGLAALPCDVHGGI